MLPGKEAGGKNEKKNEGAGNAGTGETAMDRFIREEVEYNVSAAVPVPKNNRQVCFYR